MEDSLLRITMYFYDGGQKNYGWQKIGINFAENGRKKAGCLSAEGNSSGGVETDQCILWNIKAGTALLAESNQPTLDQLELRAWNVLTLTSAATRSRTEDSLPI